MECRNLLNFILSLLIIFSLMFFVPLVNTIISTLAITFFAIKLAEWFTEISRKYFLYKRVSPNNKVVLITALVNSVISALAITFFVIKLAEWLTEISRKYFLYKRVPPNNKVALITGCDTGFGNTLARRMDKLGYSVLATCLNPDGEGPVKLSQECSKKLTVLPMDITDEQSIHKVKAFTEKNYGRNALWAVVNNAGTMHCGHVEWTSVEEFQKACDVNTFGALRVTKAFLPFIKQSKGRIVNITSSGGHYVIPGYSAYCLSKSAAIALTTSLQMELSKWGVKCIGIEPFLYSTSLVGQTMFSVARKTWNAAPPDVKAEYGSDYFEAFQTTITRILSVLANSNLSQVIDCLEDAITAEDPLPVYIPANLFHKILVLTLYRSLPLGMKEYLAGCIFELGGKPLSLRRKKRNNN